jgi:peptide/nickel transport system permease protein
MSYFILRKALRAIFTMWLVVTFAFVVLRLSGDPVELLLGDAPDPATLDYYRARYGFDRPIWEQYLGYFANVLHGDLGISIKDERDAVEAVLQALPRTLQLGLASLALSLAIGIPLGMIAAVYRNRAADRFAMSFAVFGFSMPNFFLAILLILLFSLQLRWLPSSGAGTWAHMVMPTIALGMAGAGSIARFTRSSMLEVLSKPYMRTASAKGVPPLRRFSWHALPNAAIPIVTIIGFRLGDLVAGAIVIESVFAWPGVGRLLVSSVSSRDLAIVQAILLMVAFTMVAANFLVDLLYGWIDPRMRTGGSGQEKS